MILNLKTDCEEGKIYWPMSACEYLTSPVAEIQNAASAKFMYKLNKP